MDLVTASEEADRVLRRLLAWRSDAEDVKFNEVFNAAEELHKKHHDGENVPNKYRARSPSRSQYKSNAPGKDTRDIYKINMWYPTLDLVIREIRERFSKSSKIAMRMAKLLPAHCLEEDSTVAAGEAYEEYCAFLESRAAFEAEFESWREFCRDLSPADRAAMTIDEAIRRCNASVWPNVSKLLRIFLTTPVTTCTAERSFSLLRRLKNYMRSTMTEGRLNGLAMLAVHKDIKLDYEEVIAEYLPQI
jgi:hypothetical protein